MTTTIPEGVEKPNNRTCGSFVPLLLLALGILGTTILPTIRLLAEQQALKNTAAEQVTLLANAYKIRTAADSLFSKTQALADKGNQNARIVVEALKQRGLTINPNAQTPAPPQ